MERMTLQCAYEIMEENIKKNRKSRLLPCLFDARLAAGSCGFLLADLVRKTALSVTAAKNQVCVGWAVRLSGFRGAAIFPDCQPGASLGWAHPRLHGGSTTILAGWASILSGTSIGRLALYGSNPASTQVTQVMTDGSRREIEVGRLRVRFFCQTRD